MKATKLSMAKMRALMGWVPPNQRTKEQHEADAICQTGIKPPAAFFSGRKVTENKGRVCLWKALRAVLQLPANELKIPYIRQITGSCVGAGGGNMQRHLQAVQIYYGNLAAFKEPWWVLTYGRSRYRGGFPNPGEGSFGSAYAAAAEKDGYVSQDSGNFPNFIRTKYNWLMLTKDIEMSWSDGNAPKTMELLPESMDHLITSTVRVESAEEAKTHLWAGNPITIASQFGTKTIQARGNPPVNIARYDDKWGHQMSLGECWDHPTEGLIFLVVNQWDGDAHPAPAGDAPYGTFYIVASDLNQIIAERETFAFSAYVEHEDNLPIDWAA